MNISSATKGIGINYVSLAQLYHNQLVSSFFCQVYSSQNVIRASSGVSQELSKIKLNLHNPTPWAKNPSEASLFLLFFFGGLITFGRQRIVLAFFIKFRYFEILHDVLFGERIRNDLFP